jgi:hypothetical protein
VKRLVVAMAVILAVALLVPAVAGAAPMPNNNAGYVDFTCGNDTVTIWVNFVGSDSGGHAPAIVVAGSDAQVFKVVSYQAPDYPPDPTVHYTGFPVLPSFELVTCTHDSPYGVVILTGVFIP